MMDTLQQQFPQEVIDMIVNQLHGDATTLKQCSLTAKAFVYTSQQLLFHTIYLDRYYVAQAQCQQLCQTLTESPHLGSFVQELHVMDGPATPAGGSIFIVVSGWMANGAIDFLTLLSLLPHLQYLDLSSFIGFDWKMFSEAMESSILDTLKRISKLRLCNINNVPLAEFQTFNGMKNLTLDNVRFDTVRPRTAVVTPCQGYLEFLQFGHRHYTGTRALVEELLLPTSSLSITQLRRLSIAGHSTDLFDIVSTVIAASGHVLEALTWKMNTMRLGNFGPSFDSFHLGMASNLRHLSLSFTFTNSLGGSVELQWLAYNLARTQFAISTELEILDVKITQILTDRTITSLESVSDHMVWTDLDAALAAPRYSKLRQASFFIETGRSEDSSKREWLRAELARRMPLLSDKKALVLVV